MSGIEMDRPMTKRQQEVLDLIAASVASRGFPPSVRELGAMAGIVGSSAHQHLRALEKRGLLKHRSQTTRTWHITAKGWLHVAAYIREKVGPGGTVPGAP